MPAALAPTKPRTRLLAALLAATIAGCATPPEPIQIEGLVIRNATPVPVTDVVLRVEETGAHVACNFVGPGAEFMTVFPNREYQGNAAIVAWTQRGRRWTSPPTVIFEPEALDLAQAVRVVVILGEHGRMAIGMFQ